MLCFVCQLLLPFFIANKSSLQPSKLFFLAVQRSLFLPPQICPFCSLKWCCHPLRTLLFWDYRFCLFATPTIVLI
ncbi:hypothetical protein ES288_A07G184700v1 [Gossypium darwinii]|uniref:Uncharacterized protein n=1 Tax=Gossypium darwinii TaxID=34276 RepID=A0A5D2FYM2_GOSDA|nr:hypothetical protein ES288_A07G184700v1 [Gossypium darwinii]